MGLRALVVNAQHVKQVPGHKTDTSDAEWLAMLARASSLRGSFIPPEQLRPLRQINCYHQRTTAMLAMEKNHLAKVLSDAGIRLSGAVSDLHGAASSGVCGACHLPHNAVADKLWAKDIGGDRDFAFQLCAGCHNKQGAAKEKVIGDNSHPVDVSLRKFGITTSLPLYDARGSRSEDGKLVCMTCHDPHVWDPAGQVTDYESKNMEGTASNSFLRKVNFPSSDLCKTCHANQALVDGTDHDLNVTAQDAKNLLGQTVRESGQCGACHLVHNGQNKLSHFDSTI